VENPWNFGIVSPDQWATFPSHGRGRRFNPYSAHHSCSGVFGIGDDGARSSIDWLDATDDCQLESIRHRFRVAPNCSKRAQRSDGSVLSAE
jgi:hypothetical protein